MMAVLWIRSTKRILDIIIHTTIISSGKTHTAISLWGNSAYNCVSLLVH